MIAEKNPDLLKLAFGKKIAGLVYEGKYGDVHTLWGEGMNARKVPLEGPEALTRTMWERLTAAAEQFNEPGRFTALIGVEWTSSPGGNNLHRNVVFRDGKAPTFMIRALRDVDGANLDRVQIVKGWLDGDGELHEQAYDVLSSDGRAITDEHRCEKPVGNTMDIEKATYTNSIGDALMMAYWKDPAFDPKQRAFYYVRVLEIPTPRWTTYDAAFFGVQPGRLRGAAVHAG